MKLPSLIFTDSSGVELPKEDGKYHSRQFREIWQVTTSVDWSGSVGLVASNGETFPLAQVPNTSGIARWQLPYEDAIRTKNIDRAKIYRNTIGASGEITAVLLDIAGRPVRQSNRQFLVQETLITEPTNITDSEFNQMLREIALLSLSSYSCAQARMQAPTGLKAGADDSFGFQWYPRRGNLTIALSVLNLSKVLGKHIPAIELAPLSEITRESIPTRLPSMRPSVHEIRVTRERPFIRTAALPNSHLTTDCVENRFVLWLIRNFVPSLINQILHQLTRDIDSLTQDINLPDNSILRASARDLAQRSRARTGELMVDVEKLRNKIRALYKDLERAAVLMRALAARPVFASIQMLMSLPKVTTRLMESPRYAEIYQAFLIVKGGRNHQLERILRLITLIDTGHVRPTWEVYEMWCFARIYEGLVTGIADLAPAKGQSLIDRIYVSKGELKISTDPCKLVFDSKNPLHRHDTAIRLWHEPAVRTRARTNGTSGELRPDILLEVTSSSGTKHFVFDAKYRGYGAVTRDGRTRLIEDVRDVAYTKYFKSLGAFQTGTPLSIAASFILHSEQDARFDYWGERPFDRFLDQLGLPPIGMSEFAAHRYGAIRFRLDGDNLDPIRMPKIINLLRYHLGNEFSEMCLTCGCLAESVKNDAQRTQGRAYMCSNCGDFWLVHHCAGKGGKHLLHKHGPASIHLLSTPAKTKWMFKCPVCGDTGLVASTLP